MNGYVLFMDWKTQLNIVKILFSQIVLRMQCNPNKNSSIYFFCRIWQADSQIYI